MTNLFYTSEVETVHAITITELVYFGAKDIRQQVNATAVGKGVSVSDVEIWKHARKVVMQIFARKRTANLDLFGVSLEA